MTSLPAAIESVEELEELLSRPGPAVVEMFTRLDGDILVLGAGGKMGPTLARMARRAADAAGTPRRVWGVSRFGEAALPQRLRAWGVEPLAADLLDRSALAALPDARNVLFLAGMKFGSTGQEPLTWAMNCYLPALVAQRYRASRIVGFSTGNLYGLTPAAGPGCPETAPPNPVGDYAASCLGRERIFEHFSRTQGTPTLLFRLNYAVECRYGVLADLAGAVHAGGPVDLAMGHFNCIWQGDANARALRCLEQATSPATALNVTGAEVLSVRDVCARLGGLLGRPPVFAGQEAPDALLADAGRSVALFGRPEVDVETLLRWVAHWVQRGGPTLGKPTHFQSRDGKF